MRVLVTGDTHGNADWLREYIYPTAMAMDCVKIVVLGDFGYWEHTAAGVGFLNEVDTMGRESGLPLYWLHGNHDKHSLALKRYGKKRDDNGFIICREHVFYIPQGLSWAWAQRTFRAFGGAYSVDKSYRLSMENKRYNQLRQLGLLGVGAFEAPRVPSQAGTLWFPEEEMSDADMTKLLAADSAVKDIVLSHDKPSSATPGWNRKDFPECLPNQERLQKALLRHRPTYWLHGHLHYRYCDRVPSGPTSVTTVIGLEPDREAAELGWRHANTWLTLDLGGDFDVRLTPGSAAAIDRNRVERAKQLLH